MKKLFASLLLILVSISLIGCSETVHEPIVVVENIISVQDMITFDVNVTDPDKTGEIELIELYRGATLITSLEDITVREFSDLLSYTTYTIKITYRYDLLDGNGERSSVLAIEEVFTGQPNDINESAFYISKDNVANFITTFNRLPDNYMTKAQAGGHIATYWTPESLASIGGDNFQNREKLLPEATGRLYYEVDINYQGGSRGAERIVFSNDGFIFYTGDHYDSFVLYDPLTKEWNNYTKDDLIFSKN